MTKETAEKAHTPEFGTEDYRRYAVLFNDVTYAPIFNRLLFSDRRALTDYLWAQGWRREVRSEDVTERRSTPKPTVCGARIATSHPHISYECVLPVLHDGDHSFLPPTEGGIR